MATVSSPHPVDRGSPPTDARDASSSLGEFLRHAREDRGLTLETIANETKIPRRYLEALEHDDLAATPGRFYQRAELRAYARAVGLDQARVLARLESALQADESDKAPLDVAKRHESTTERAYVPLGIAIAVVAAALLARTISEDTPALQDSAETRIVDSPSNSVSPVHLTSAIAETPQRELSAPVARLPVFPTSAASTNAPTDIGAVPDGRVTTETQVTTETGEAAVSAAAVTELVVTTRPAGARVTVNGIGWGTSPVTIRYLTPGDKRIRVSKEGYAAEERLLSVSEGRRQALDIPLASAP